MAVHMKIIEELEARVRDRLLKPLEDRITALEARLDGGADAKAAPAKTAARGRGKAAPEPEPETEAAPEPEASLNDVVAAADEDALKTGK